VAVTDTEKDSAGRIRFRLDGPGIGEGWVPVPEITALLGGFQQAFTVIVEDLWGRQHRKGPVPEAIRRDATLKFGEVHAGSFEATVAVDRLAEGLPIADVAESAVEQLLDGLEAMSRGEEPQLPAAAATGLVAAVKPVLGAGHRLEVAGGRRNRRVAFDERTPLPPRPPDLKPPERVRLTGRILEIDYRDGTAELWASLGEKTVLVFDSEQVDLIDANRQAFVLVTGRWERGGRRLRVESVTPLSDDQSFWKQADIAQLAGQQGVRPVADLEALRLPSWADVDEEEFLATLRRWRAES
jgi:hypothetical protein